ncbi:hypothetical protein, partial [Streptomyces pharetrae]|uniref:hypothetical protein n=1 Tax=Streptomyces pharetrae TaxID=291370 RepID=UPI003D9ED16B
GGGLTSSARRCAPTNSPAHRKELRDAPEAGIVRDPGEEAWEAELATFPPAGHRALGTPSGTIRPAAAQ